ncbi:aminotransferase class I/II-fold pyridoxal phosphate-dependent enzyme [Paenibacillus pasadenensis]|nr:aminotransferase class I/II-fold pyridoxal phosphate-dependent enzyme [Paenibacillus pasadenensis]
MMPIVDMLQRHAAARPLSFHVPGHKGIARSLAASERWNDESDDGAPSFLAALGGLLPMDVTELSDTDDLHDPSGAIEQGQQLAARRFGAEETAFLVGGSTAGNLALLLGCTGPGDIVLVQRNVHKSVLNGIRLSGAEAVFLEPRIETASGLTELPELAAVEQALRSWPQAKALFLSTPSYYGWSRDLHPYAELVHRTGCLLLVDEAHGAHYGLHPSLPSGALQAGADAVVQSTHKTLHAMTMGAMLHMQGERLDRRKVKAMLAALQSSSPSYPIMASLDLARGLLDEHGEEWFAPGLEAAAAIRSGIRRSARWGLAEDLLEDGEIRTDPLRLVVHDRLGGIQGFELLRQLEERGIWAEMADESYVVLLVGARTGIEEAERLLAALAELEALVDEGLSAVERAFGRAEARDDESDTDSEQAHGAEAASGDDAEAGSNEAAFLFSKPTRLERFPPEERETELVPLLEAAGRISAETIIPYPPGIPLVLEGEPLTDRAIASMQRLKEARFQGKNASERGWIRVRRQ